MNQFEYKKRYDPDLGMYVKKHVHSGEIHGGAFTDILKSVASNLFGKTMKEAAKLHLKKLLKLQLQRLVNMLVKKQVIK